MEGGAGGSGSEPAGSCSQQLDAPQQQLPPLLPPAAGAAVFTKLAVRQHLAAVSAHCPAARPTRGMLRQVYNFFLSQLAA